MQSVVDAAPHARSYYSDAFNTYRELYWWGEHQAMYDKNQTYSVEAVKADLHYLARMARHSCCFSRCIHALRRAVELFVRCSSARQLHKRNYPRYLAPLLLSFRYSPTKKAFGKSLMTWYVKKGLSAYLNRRKFMNDRNLIKAERYS
jgi:hypothetical protein